MAGNEHSAVQIETELSRDLGLSSALAIGVGTMIAAGIFTLSGLAIRNVGSAAIVSFLLAAVVALFTALTYCEFVSVYPESGEGYLYARKTFSAPAAYFVGWTLVLGYTSSCAFYIASLSSYFVEFVWRTPYEGLAGLAMLVALTLLNIKGTKESGSFQIVVTLGKVLLLIWFVAGGLGSVDLDEFVARFSHDVSKISSTAGMVFITFFGFSAIAATAGEVADPVKTIKRAIFISMGLVTVLYSLVVLVVLAAGLTEYTEAAMGVAARKFLGPIGGTAIIGGALFSMISASNASIMAGSRVVLSMSRLGHFPEEFGAVNPRTRTPVVSLMLVGGTIILFVLGLGLEDLAHFADIVLLLALILVNAALIVHRRRFPDLVRPFRVPLVPLLPGLGIVANIYLLSQIVHHVLPLLLAVTCLVLGVLAFLAWKGSQPVEAAIPGVPSRVALGRYAPTEGQFRVLVPIANPANVHQLIGLAAGIAAERKGEIVALRVTVVPEQLPLAEQEAHVEQERHILEAAYERAREFNVHATSLVRVGHNAARAILETARERECNLIVIGWKGYTATSKKILGEVTDAVVAHARTDIILAKLVGKDLPRRFLLPTAGGNHARSAEDYIGSIVRSYGGSVTFCSVAPPDASDAALTETNTRLSAAVARMAGAGDVEVTSKVVRSPSVTEAILTEGDDYEAVVLGATGMGWVPQILFGQLPETIGKRSRRSVLLVKHYEPVRALLGRVLRE